MAFDVKAFVNWNLSARFFLRETFRRKEFRQTKPNLTSAWVNALSELANLIKKHTEAMLARLPEGELKGLSRQGKEAIDPKTSLSLSLVKRLQDFPHRLHYHIDPNGIVLIYSEDRYLEGALYFGTRQLPRLRPIDYLVSRMSLRLADRSLVFIARDFSKPHESQDDFKRDNLRQVTPYYT
jgi:hypothetical protein